MLKNLFIVLAVSLLATNLTFAQAAKGSADEPKSLSTNLYKLNAKFMLNVFHKYILTEESKITRTSSDEKTVTYNRKVVYHLNLKQNSLPENGFNEVKLLLDSLEYYLSEDGEQKVAYNSQDDEANTPYNVLDYMNYGIPLGKECNINYSPYNDVADIKGEVLDEFRARLDHPEDGLQDPDAKYIWKRYLSNSYLAFLGDVMKNTIPGIPIDRDSTWKGICSFYVDGVQYFDTMNVALKDFNPREFVVSAELDSLIGVAEPVNVLGFNEIVQIYNPKGRGIITVHGSPRGQINLTEIEAETEFYFKIDKTEYKQTTQTKYSWKLDKMFR